MVTVPSPFCAVFEGCVNAIGKRKLLRFDVATPNVGNADLVLGDPTNNPLFVYSACHQHYHFNGYALYELLDRNGATVLTGRKQAFCLEDFSRYDPTAGPDKFTCAFQGISVGWQDVYGSYLDCQSLDVTDAPPGKYQLRVTINRDLLLMESDYTQRGHRAGDGFEIGSDPAIGKVVYSLHTRVPARHA